MKLAVSMHHRTTMHECVLELNLIFIKVYCGKYRLSNKFLLNMRFQFIIVHILLLWFKVRLVILEALAKLCFSTTLDFWYSNLTETNFCVFHERNSERWQPILCFTQRVISITSLLWKQRDKPFRCGKPFMILDLYFVLFLI